MLFNWDFGSMLGKEAAFVASKMASAMNGHWGHAEGNFS